MYLACMVEHIPGGDLTGALWNAQVLFSGDHLAADVVGEWTAKHEDMGDGFLGISRSFNCELNSFIIRKLARALGSRAHCSSGTVHVACLVNAVQYA